MNKRGSHVGVIISFIIFIGMIVFLYVIIAPTIFVSRGASSTINSLQPNLESNITGNITSISFYVDNSNMECAVLLGFISAAGLSSPSHLLVVNSSGDSTPSNLSSSGSTDLYIVRNSATSGVFYAYDSSDFAETQSGTYAPCKNLNEGTGSDTYRIGQIKTIYYPTESRILDLISEYNSSYDNVKSNFNVPGNFNFGFNFTYQNGTSIGTEKNISSSTGVYSRSFPLTYITKSASVQQGKLTINVWQ